MNKTVKIFIVVIILVLVVFVLSIARNTDSNEPITIGFAASISGDAATYGEPAKKAMELAIAEINEKGGINGRQLVGIYEDSKCNGKDAVTAVQKLTGIDKVKIITGMICSGEVLGALPITEQNKVILMTQGSSPEITNRGNYNFRTWPSDIESGRMLAEAAIVKHKTAAIITESTEYTIALEKIFMEEYEKRGGRIVSNESYPPNSTDFRSQLSKMKAANPEVVFINAQLGASAARIATQLREMGSTAQFYAAFFTGEDFLKAGKAVEGTIIVDTPVLDPNNAKSKVFLEAYSKKYSAQPSYAFIAGASYDQVNIIAQALKKYGEDTEKISEYLYGMPKYSGVIGTFSFDKNGDVSGINLSMRQIKDGKVVEYK